ncbi:MULTISPECIES: TIGR03087 family PEP-CTERM/XrtA system glycosyltransferase [unclassified Janthinobacterium]|uniref:TIGR03087 family PEP-CTERM/XrtA system glycosyltransferase n=1 Tax=unclassified Janthinobacterium TaxID=2610881 RepID=UPI00034C3858|nr:MULTISPECIES: TIGR03087 family PEP-CTERM/XrtA system glycosyltransferase [unclassified Janthinobacterium]MEC5161308.1 sugar transferase (PEP-CTERM/EpsH1 system associated) [Janthinobacterium sp. CG_S6]
MDELLFLAHRIPYPPNKGDKIRSFHMLEYLARHCRVHLGCFVDDPADLEHAGALGELCASTCFIEHHPLAARLRGLKGLLYGQAMSLHYYRNARLQHWVDRLLGGGAVGRALAFSGPMAQYLAPHAAAPALLRLIDFVDVDSEKWRQYADAKDWPLSQLYRREARCLLDYEGDVAARFDAATFVSEAEAALFRRRAPQAAGRVSAVRNGVDAGYFSPLRAYPNPYPAGAAALVFTGAMDYWPNAEAVQWFVWRVWPSLRLQFPDLRFYIVGARPGAAVRALARAPGVSVTGAVPDIRPYLAHARLAVAPLRIARGVQNKVLEAMAMEKTVLASPQALEGIDAVPGQELELARDEAEFISQAARLLGRPGAGPPQAPDPVGMAARRRILRDYDWDASLDRLGALLGLEPAARAPAGALP